MTPVDRIPLAHSVVYAVRGAPEVPDEYNAERTIAPHEITLTYRTSEDSQLGRVHAYVKGWWMQDDSRVPMDKPVGRHFWGRNFDGWPEWLAEEARLHDPERAAVAAPTNWIDGHPQLEAIAAAVWEQCGRSDSGMCVEDDPRNIAVAALAAVLPPPVSRADVLREAADRIDREDLPQDQVDMFDNGARWATKLLRRMADEEQGGHDK